MHLCVTCNVQYLLKEMSRDVDDYIIISKAVTCAVIIDCMILKDTPNMLSTSPDRASLINAGAFPLFYSIVVIFLCCIWRVPKQGNSSS